MITKLNFFGLACRLAVLSFLVAGPVSLMHAQQSALVDSSTKAPLLLASLNAPLDSASSSSSSSDSSDSGMTSVGRFKLNGQLRGYSPLSRLVELEILMAGIDAKRSRPLISSPSREVPESSGSCRKVGRPAGRRRVKRTS